MPTNINEILQYLQNNGSQAHKKSVARMGIPPENAFGVSIAIIRKLAKHIRQNNELAFNLWDCSKHEARLLAVLLVEPDKISGAKINKWLNDVVSWDLCDHLCKGIIAKRNDAIKLVNQFAQSPKEFVRRAAFSTIANISIHQNELDEDIILHFLRLIEDYADDNRIYVKKSISWALREIGKRDIHCHELALNLAYELAQSDDKNRRWVAKNALKELEILVSVPERKRLLTRKSKMGQKSTS